MSEVSGGDAIEIMEDTTVNNIAIKIPNGANNNRTDGDKNHNGLNLNKMIRLWKPRNGSLGKVGPDNNITGEVIHNNEDSSRFASLVRKFIYDKKVI